MTAPHNWMQERQNKVTCEFGIKGVADWRSFLAEPLKLISPWWIERCGGSEVPLEVYLRKEAAANVQSYERSLVTAFLNSGYRLEELEAEIDCDKNTRTWGRCVWYKDHPNYRKPLDKLFDGTALNDPSLFFATWKTEHAGDQEFCIYSMQMIASTSILPHKTLIYHKVIFSPPRQAAAA